MATTTVFPKIPLTSSSFSRRCVISRKKMNSVDAVQPFTKKTMSCRCITVDTGVGEDVFSVTSSSSSGGTKCDVDYLGESTKGDLNLKSDLLLPLGVDGKLTLEGPIEEVAKMEAEEAEALLRHLEIPVL